MRLFIMSDDDFVIDDESSSDGELLPVLNLWNIKPKAELDTEDGDELRKTLRRVQKERVDLDLVTSIVRTREQQITVETLLNNKVHVSAVEDKSSEIKNQSNGQFDKKIFDTSIPYVCRGTKVFDVEKFQCIFRVKDVTLISCGYNMLSDLSKYEKELLRTTADWILQNLPKLLLMGRPHNITNPSAFLLYLLKIASVSDSPPLLYSIEEHIKIFLSNSRSEPFISIEEILKIFINFGMIVEPHFPSKVLKSVHDSSKNASVVEAFGNRPVKDKHWFNNLNATISILDCLLDHLEIKDRHLLELFLIVLWMCVDENLLHSEIRSTLKNYLNNILEKFSVEFLNSGEVSTAITKLEESNDDSSRYPLLSEIIKVIPIYSAKGKKLKQASSYKVLCCVLQLQRRLTDDKVEFSDLLFALKKFNPHLCNCKDNVWDPVVDTMISLIDNCAGFDPVAVLPKPSMTDLNDVLRKCKFKIKNGSLKEHFERMIVRFRGFIFEPAFIASNFSYKEELFKRKGDISEGKEMDIDAHNLKHPYRKIKKYDGFKSPFTVFKEPFLPFQHVDHQRANDQKANSSKDAEVAMGENSANSNLQMDSSIIPNIISNLKNITSRETAFSGNENVTGVTKGIFSRDSSTTKIHCSETYASKAFMSDSLSLCEVEQAKQTIGKQLREVEEDMCISYAEAEHSIPTIICSQQKTNSVPTESIEEGHEILNKFHSDQAIVDENMSGSNSKIGVNDSNNFVNTASISSINLVSSPLCQQGQDVDVHSALLQEVKNTFISDTKTEPSVISEVYDLQNPIINNAKKSEHQTPVKSRNHQRLNLVIDDMLVGENVVIDDTSAVENQDFNDFHDKGLVPYLGSSLVDHHHEHGEDTRNRELFRTRLKKNHISFFDEHHYSLPYNHSQQMHISDTIIKNGYPTYIKPHSHQKINILPGEISHGQNTSFCSPADTEIQSSHVNFITSFKLGEQSQNNEVLPDPENTLISYSEHNYHLIDKVHNTQKLNPVSDVIKTKHHTLIDSHCHQKLNAVVDKVSVGENVIINDISVIEAQNVSNFNDGVSLMSNSKLSFGIEQQQKNIGGGSNTLSYEVENAGILNSGNNHNVLIEGSSHPHANFIIEISSGENLINKTRSAAEVLNSNGFCDNPHVSHAASRTDSTLSFGMEERDDIPDSETGDVPHSKIYRDQRVNFVSEEVSDNNQSMPVKIPGLQNLNIMCEGMVVRSTEEKLKSVDVDVYNMAESVTNSAFHLVNEANSKVSSIEQPSTFKQSTTKTVLNDDNFELPGSNDILSTFKKLEQAVSNLEQKELSKSCSTVNAAFLNGSCIKCQSEFTASAISCFCTHCSSSITEDIPLIISKDGICKNNLLQSADPPAISISTTSGLTMPGTVFSKTPTNETVTSRASLNRLSNYSPNLIAESVDFVSRTEDIQIRQHRSASSDQFLPNVDTQGKLLTVSDLERSECPDSQLSVTTQPQNVCSSFDDQLKSDLSKVIFNSSNDQLTNATVNVSSVGSIVNVNVKNEFVISVSKDLESTDAQLNGTVELQTSCDSLISKLDSEFAISKVVFDSFSGELDNVKVRVDSDESILNVDIQSESVLPVSILEDMGSSMSFDETTESQTRFSLGSDESVNETINNDSGELGLSIGTGLQSSDQMPKFNANIPVSRLVTPVLVKKEVTSKMCQKSAQFEEPCSSFADSGADVINSEWIFSSETEETMDDEVQVLKVVQPISSRKKKLLNIKSCIPCQLKVPTDKAHHSALYCQSRNSNADSDFTSARTDMQSTDHTSHNQLHNHNVQVPSAVKSRVSNGLFSNQLTVSENVFSTVRSIVQVPHFTMNLIASSQNPAVVTPSSRSIVDRQWDTVTIPLSDNNRTVRDHPHQGRTHSAENVSSPAKIRTSNKSPEPIVITDDEDDDSPVIEYELYNGIISID